MEAQMIPFWTWVPAPGRYVDVVASCWPGTARVGKGFSMALFLLEDVKVSNVLRFDVFGKLRRRK
jgi:hypothetical protein